MMYFSFQTNQPHFQYAVAFLLRHELMKTHDKQEEILQESPQESLEVTRSSSLWMMKSVAFFAVMRLNKGQLCLPNGVWNG